VPATNYLAVARQVARMSTLTCWTYRFNWAFDMVGLLAQIYVLKMVWTAVYAGQAEIDGLPLDQLVAYLTLANLQLWVMFPVLAEYISGRVRDGLVAQELARPVPFLVQMVGFQVGDTAAGLPFILVALPAAFYLGGLLPPASPLTAVLYLVSVLLGWLVVVMTGLVLGIVSFWTTEIAGFMSIHAFVSRFFAGAFVPLALMPSWLAQLASVLAFRAQAEIPLSIYLGQASGAEVPTLMAVQVFWVVALFLLARVLWGLAVRRVVVYGG
jgi:ABC-2 type transport system permease protein